MKNGELKRLAKIRLKGNWGVAIAAFVVLTIILSVLSSGNIVNRALSFTRSASGGGSSNSGNSDYTAVIAPAETQSTSTALGATGLLGGFFNLALAVAELILVGPLFFGFTAIFLDIIRNSRSKFPDLFAGFKRFGTNMGTGLLLNLFILLWSLLFVIPGIIKIYAYAMVWNIQNDHPEMRGTDAITASKNLMKGNKGKLFLLDLSFIGWYLLVPFTAGLILLYVVPYHMAARTAFYDQLVGKPVEEQAQAQPVEEDPFGESAAPTSEPFGEKSHGDIVYGDDDPFAQDGGETIDGGD